MPVLISDETKKQACKPVLILDETKKAGTHVLLFLWIKSSASCKTIA